jgi:hypothetical protein
LIISSLEHPSHNRIAALRINLRFVLFIGVFAMVDPFESPKLLLEEARADIGDLIERSDAFFKAHPPTGIEEIDPKSGEKLVKIRQTSAIPGRIRTRATSVLNDLRHALDQATVAASLLLGAKGTDNVYFPFADSPVDLDHVLTGPHGRCRKVPAALHPILKRFEPFPTAATHKGGDDLLRILGRLSGPSKHRVILDIDLNLQGIHVETAKLMGAAMLGPQWDAKKKEVILFRVMPGGHVDYKISAPFFIAFGKGPISGQPAIGVLSALSDKVEKILSTIEAETMLLLKK